MFFLNLNYKYTVVSLKVKYIRKCKKSWPNHLGCPLVVGIGHLFPFNKLTRCHLYVQSAFKMT